MNDFETTLATTLHAEADQGTVGLDTVAAAQRLQAAMVRVDRAGRNRHRLAWGTGLAAAAAIAIALVLTGQGHRTSDQPVGQPTPAVPGGQAVASQPYISAPSLFGNLVRQSGPPPRLLVCVDPRTWGAVEVQGAPFINPAPDPKTDSLVRLNEFVLQYPDATTAGRALVAAVQQVRSCPTRGHGWARDHLRIDRTPDRRLSFDEAWASERLHWPPGPRRGHVPTSSYTFRIARADNVVVVIETTGGVDDRSGTALDVAVAKALPAYHRSH